MYLMNIQLKDLIGTWRSKEDENHYWDLSIIEGNNFFYDEIKDGKRIIEVSLEGIAILEFEELPILVLNHLKLKIVWEDILHNYLLLQYPDNSRKELKKLNYKI